MSLIAVDNRFRTERGAISLSSLVSRLSSLPLSPPHLAWASRGCLCCGQWHLCCGFRDCSGHDLGLAVIALPLWGAFAHASRGITLSLPVADATLGPGTLSVLAGRPNPRALAEAHRRRRVAPSVVETGALFAPFRGRALLLGRAILALPSKHALARVVAERSLGAAPVARALFGDAL